MKTKNWIITDWANNILDHSGFVKNPQLAVPMTFESWDDAEEWLSENLSDYEHDRGEYYIEEKTQ